VTLPIRWSEPAVKQDRRWPSIPVAVRSGCNGRLDLPKPVLCNGDRIEDKKGNPAWLVPVKDT
jgi:hypothetical protein